MPVPRVLAAHDSMVLLVDMQIGLLPAIDNALALVARVHRLLSAARLLQVPVVATEHCADKIGGTDPDLASLADEVLHKVHFDATREPGLLQRLPVGRHNVLVVGTEAHVCVLQTALGLAASGLLPWLVSDGIGSRRESDRVAAVQRWLQGGGNLVSSEMAMFEWLGSARHPAFREVLSLVKASGDTIVSDSNDSSVSESQRT